MNVLKKLFGIIGMINTLNEGQKAYKCGKISGLRKAERLIRAEINRRIKEKS